MKALFVYRHRLPTRLGHWVTVLCVPILVLSGFQIFNAHPALYWGERSDGERAVLAMRAERMPGGTLKGITRVFGRDFDTTGVLGASRDGVLGIQDRGFPNWATLPGHQWLAMGRRWHFFFAWAFVLNGVAFAGYAVLGRHLSRDLVPSGPELRAIGRALRDHLLFRFRHGGAADRYNVLQKLSYVSIIFVAAPLLVLTGLAMSPRVDAAVPCSSRRVRRAPVGENPALPPHPRAHRVHRRPSLHGPGDRLLEQCAVDDPRLVPAVFRGAR